MHPPRLSPDEAKSRGTQSTSVEWEAFIDEAPKIVDELSTGYSFRGSVPKIHFLDSWDFLAFATPSDEIEISLGTLRYCLNVDRLVTTKGQEIPVNWDLYIGKGISRTIFHWVIAHELTHIFRSHYAVLSRLGPSCIPGLEYDADMLGAAATLRSNSRHCAPGPPPLSIRRYTLHALYWGVRQTFWGSPMENQHAMPYLSWFQRIRLISFKLAATGYWTDDEEKNSEFLNGGPVSQIITAFAKDLGHLELAFAQINSLPAPSLITGEFAQVILNQDPIASRAIAIWTEIQPLVIELGRI